MKTNYDFAYIGHGYGYFINNLECFVWFENSLNAEEREWVQETAPKPIAHFFNWTENILNLGSNDLLGWNIRKAYSKENVAELEADDDFDPYDEDNDDVIPFDTEWEAFHDDIDKWLKEVNEKHPVIFFLRPDSEYVTFSKWHDFSLEQIPDKILDLINEFYNKPAANSIENEKAKKIIPVILNELFFLYFAPNDVQSVSKELALKGTSVIIKTLGYDDDMDEENFVRLSNFMQQLDENRQINIVKSFSANSKVLFFSTYHEITRKLFYEVMGENPIQYLKNLLKETKNDFPEDLIYDIGFNIANVEFKETTNTREMIENEDSNPILGIKIVELCFDYPNCDEEKYRYAYQLYSSKGMNEAAFRVCKLQIEKKTNTISYMLFDAIKFNDYDHVEELIEYSLGNENIINNSYTLSDIIYSLTNISINSSDPIKRQKYSDVAVKLTKDYWIKENKTLFPNLYVNMMEAFIVADLMDSVFDDIVNAALAELEKDPEQLGGKIYIGLACYYAMKGDKANVIRYLNETKKIGLPGFDNFKTFNIFNPYKKDEEFISIFE